MTLRESRGSATAYFGGGCFWCTEAFFVKASGVLSVESGYGGGGKNDKPTYWDHGDHAEMVKISYLPETISYWDLMHIFWLAHNPTTLNRDGANVGREYRSIVLFTNPHQQYVAEVSKMALAPKIWSDRIVTALEPFDAFHRAEDHHQSFYTQNPQVGYCQVVIDPKLKKHAGALSRYQQREFVHLDTPERYGKLLRLIEDVGPLPLGTASKLAEISQPEIRELSEIQPLGKESPRVAVSNDGKALVSLELKTKGT